ncbi:MAG: hypothetical protein QM729_14835 [Solirubrobacterales bacterium]
MKKSLLLLSLVLIASALALAACGGGGSSSSSGGSGEEEAIAEVIEKSATTTGPSKCTELQTQTFNEQEKDVSGKEATEVCEEAAEGEETVAEGVDVSEIKVDGETATAVAEVEGTALNGQGLELELVSEEGKWKLNKFLAFAHYDGQALAEALEKEFEKEEGISAALGKCVAEGVAEFSQAEAEEVAFEGQTEGLAKLAETCQEAE